MPLVVITRGALELTFTFAQALAERLDCACISREDVLEKGKMYGLDQSKLDRLGILEKNPPALWDRWKAERDEFLALYKAALMDFVATECMVYVGNIGREILGEVPRLLRTRLDASTQFRVDRRMEEAGLSRPEAAQWVERVDRQRENWTRFLFEVDYYQHANYDLILNIESLSTETLVELAATALQRTEFVLTDDDRKRIKCLQLRARVYAALIMAPRTRGMELSIECDADSGKVLVRGAEPMVGTNVWRQDIEEALAGVEGVKAVEIQLPGAN